MHPRVQALLLAAPPDESDTAAVVAHQVTIRKALGSPKYPTKDSLLRAYVLRDIRRCYYPVGDARQGAAALVAGDRREEMKRISVPTVVVHGDSDPLVPVEAGREVAATIPGATLRIIPGLGHDFPLQLVPTFVDAVVDAATAGGKAKQ
jgi:pimeloyl-ACP methyl ester carboxylesterase